MLVVHDKMMYEHKMLMKKILVEIWRFLVIHIVIFKDSLL